MREEKVSEPQLSCLQQTGKSISHKDIFKYSSFTTEAAHSFQQENKEIEYIDKRFIDYTRQSFKTTFTYLFVDNVRNGKA